VTFKQTWVLRLDPEFTVQSLLTTLVTTVYFTVLLLTHTITVYSLLLLHTQSTVYL
jgi:hypothetical protein